MYYLEDLEDIYHAGKNLEDIKAGRERVVSMEEMEKAIGLEN